jgi:SPP1 family predicted phage head-tail adaptor
MNAGRFDELVEVWRYTSEQNQYGDPIKTWTKVSDIYASIEYLTGSEDVNGDQWENHKNINLKIRYLSDLTVKDRIKHNGVYLNIISISEIDRRMYQKVQCREVI